MFFGKQVCNQGIKNITKLRALKFNYELMSEIYVI